MAVPHLIVWCTADCFILDVLVFIPTSMTHALISVHPHWNLLSCCFFSNSHLLKVTSSILLWFCISQISTDVELFYGDLYAFYREMYNQAHLRVYSCVSH